MSKAASISKSVLGASHNGRELELMIAGRKPLAIFYRLSKEKFDEFGDQDFEKYVRMGKIYKRRFVVYYRDYDRRMIYTAFFLRGEEWRFNIYKYLMKTLSSGWSVEKEAMSSYLLGYSFEEVNRYVKEYIRLMRGE